MYTNWAREKKKVKRTGIGFFLWYDEEVKGRKETRRLFSENLLLPVGAPLEHKPQRALRTHIQGDFS